MANWLLIGPTGDLVKQLAGRPTQIAEGYTLRCTETVNTKAGYGNHHVALPDGTAGAVNMIEHFTYFEHEIVIEGTNPTSIELVRTALKKKIGVNITNI